MAWHWPGDKPWSEPMMISWLKDIYVSLSLNELMAWKSINSAHFKHSETTNCICTNYQNMLGESPEMIRPLPTNNSMVSRYSALFQKQDTPLNYKTDKSRGEYICYKPTLFYMGRTCIESSQCSQKQSGSGAVIAHYFKFTVWFVCFITQRCIFPSCQLILVSTVSYWCDFSVLYFKDFFCIHCHLMPVLSLSCPWAIMSWQIFRQYVIMGIIQLCLNYANWCVHNYFLLDGN